MAEKHDDLNLSDQKKIALLGIVHTDGYQVILDIMEYFCNREENDLIGTHPAKHDEVLASHAIVHAQRAYFQSVVAKIDMIAQQQTGIKKDNRRMTEEANLMSAMPLEDTDVM